MKTWITLAIALAVSTAHREIASLSWLMPYCPSGASPWSPNGELIALYADGGRLGIFDVTHPENPPKVVLEMPSPTNMVVAWSPDGNWIACHTGHVPTGRATSPTVLLRKHGLNLSMNFAFMKSIDRFRSLSMNRNTRTCFKTS